MFTTSRTYPWPFATQIFHNSQPSHGGDRTIFEVMTSTLLIGTPRSVASLLAVTLERVFEDYVYLPNYSRNYMDWLTDAEDQFQKLAYNYLSDEIM